MSLSSKQKYLAEAKPLRPSLFLPRHLKESPDIRLSYSLERQKITGFLPLSSGKDTVTTTTTTTKRIRSRRRASKKNSKFPQSHFGQPHQQLEWIPGVPIISRNSVVVFDNHWQGLGAAQHATVSRYLCGSGGGVRKTPTLNLPRPRLR